MGSEVLAIPEEQILEFVEVLKAGTSVVPVSPELEKRLAVWCQEMIDYYGNPNIVWRDEEKKSESGHYFDCSIGRTGKCNCLYGSD